MSLVIEDKEARLRILLKALIIRSQKAITLMIFSTMEQKNQKPFLKAKDLTSTIQYTTAKR